MSLVSAVWPIKTINAPVWNVCVVNEVSSPVEGVLVRESYQDYSAERTGHEADLSTPASGCVRFPPRPLQATILKRAFATISSATAGVHASFGPHAYVTAFAGSQRGDDVRDSYVYDWHGSPDVVNSTLTLR
jgi:hypothetical protein